MKRVLLFCTILAIALSAQSAKADSFSVSFDGGPLGFSGSGVFVGTYDSSDGGFDITSVLSGSVTDPGFGSSNIVGLSTYAGADQILYLPGGPYFDASGLSFTLANGYDINLYDTIYGPFYLDGAVEGNPNPDMQDIAEPVNFAVSPAPEPSSFLLFGTGALGLVGLLRRRLTSADSVAQ